MSLSKTKNELLSESSCEFNDRKERVCQTVEPGGIGVGGCAFDGAQIVLVPIKDAAHLVHGTSGCFTNSYNQRGSLASGEAHLFKRSFSTDLTEQDIIHGSEGKLSDAIKFIYEQYKPAAIFVYTTCVTALIGEDIRHICKTLQKELALPVIPVESPGFAGSKNFGNRIAGETLLEYVIGTKEPAIITQYDVNLIGEYNIAGELWSIKALLTKLGVRVQATITGDANYYDIASCHKAKLNVMVCSRALINIAREMKEKYGIPYIEESFFGIQNTSNAIRNIARHFDGLTERAEALINEEEEKLKNKLAPIMKRLDCKKVVLYTGGVKSWSIISALTDLGMEVVACGTRKSTPQDLARIKELVNKDVPLLKDTGPEALIKLVKDAGADMMVAGGRNQYTAFKAKLPYLDVNQERETPFACYDGIVEFAKMLDTTLSSPIWDYVRKERPW